MNTITATLQAQISIKNLIAELEQCISWAEYANDFYADTSLYDKEVCPLDSEYFDTEQIDDLYSYFCEYGLTVQDLFINQYSPTLYVISLNEDMCGQGVTLLDAMDDVFKQLSVWHTRWIERQLKAS
jgi:hypothetical protein